MAIAGEANAKLCMSHLIIEVLVGLWVPTPSSIRHVQSSYGPRRICPALILARCDHVNSSYRFSFCVCSVCICST